MSPSPRFHTAAQAARKLGVSAKALRLYEQRGLLIPGRNAAGWRAYGSADLAQAAHIVALRRLGFSLAQIARVLAGDAHGLEPALASHQAALAAQHSALTVTIEQIRQLRHGLTHGVAPSLSALIRLAQPTPTPVVSFELPWPWGGEVFELPALPALSYIIGPLGSGKTRLAQHLAAILPNATFLSLDRTVTAPPAAHAAAQIAQDWLAEDGATPSDALTALLLGIAAAPATVVVDMIEQGLDEVTQQAVIAYLRRRGPGAQPLMLLTRSSAILDLAAIGPDEAIILCPANHSPPVLVPPYPGAPGYETVASCLATPEVRARSAGMVATFTSHA